VLSKSFQEGRPFEFEIVEMGILDPQATEQKSCSSADQNSASAGVTCTNGRKDLDKDF